MSAFVLALALVLSGGCDRLGIGVTKIADIAQKPADFAGREVTIRGTVMDSWQVPFIGTRTYTIKDASGSIVVVTNHDVPLTGVVVTVRGKVDNVAVLGGRALGLHIRESGGQ